MKAAANLASTIHIPPRPDILIEIAEEIASKNPDIDRIAAALKRDVTLYGAIIRLVNSPALSVARNVTTIDRAIMLLGLVRVGQLVQVITLQSQLSKTMKLNRFWDTAAEVANLMSTLAQRFTGLSSEDAYTVGMFHDFGIPLMMQAFSEYKELLLEANQNPTVALDEEETARFGFSHYDVGYEIGKLWRVPEPLNQTIRFQPQIDDLFAGKIIVDDAEAVKTLSALLDLSKNISNTYRKFWRAKDFDSRFSINPLALKHLGIDEAEFSELRDDILQKLSQQSH
jgi:HD-like signal output (HDOD) protein